MLHFIALILSRMFFKQIRISGEPYDGKSSLWIGNHSNGIVDPTVLLAFSPVLLRPLAKATLWNNIVMKFFLNLTRAIPVARTQDAKEMAEITGHAVGVVWIKEVNSRAFKEVWKGLCQGQKMLVFPEGLSHDHPYMHPLKPGVARMALDAGCPVTLQPLIIEYSEKDEFRSALYIHYCQPLLVEPGSQSVEALMQKIQHIFDENFVRFESWEEKRDWYYLFKLYYGRVPNSFPEFRSFVSSNRQKMETDPILLAKVQTMRCMLQANNIQPTDNCWRIAVTTQNQPHWLLKFLMSIALFMCVEGPILLLHTAIWGIPFEMCKRLASSTKYNRDVYATIKIANGMWIFPLWMCCVTWTITSVLSDYIPNLHIVLLWVVCVVTLPSFLLFGLYASENLKFYSGYFKYGLLQLTFPRALEEMQMEWQHIYNAVSQKIKS